MAITVSGASSGMAQNVPVIASGYGVLGYQGNPQPEHTGTGAVTVISLRLDKLSLEDVLNHIARVSGAQVSFSKAMLPDTHRVSIMADSISPPDAIRRALRGTSLQLVIQRSGRLVITSVPIQDSAETGTITGRVIGAKTKQPVPGATVSVDGQRTPVTVNADGAFRLQVPVGAHVVHAKAIGFARHSQSVTVTKDGSVMLELLLEQGANVLNEVVVTGSVIATERKAIPTPITVITGEDLERRGITRIDQILRGEVPGVFAVDAGTEVYGVSLGAMERIKVYSRGASTVTSGETPLKIYVDGVELVDPSYLGTLDTRGIERIEVITGPQAATIYGAGAMGGVMQIFTKTGTGQASEISLGLQYGMLESSLSSGRTPVHSHVFRVTGGAGPSFSYSSSLSHDYQGQWQPGLFSRRFAFTTGVTHVRGPVTVTGSASITLGRNGTTERSRAEQEKMSSGEWLGAGRNTWTSDVLTQLRSSSKSRMLTLNADYTAFPWWQHHVTLGESQTGFRLDPRAPIFGLPSDSVFRYQRSDGERVTYGYNTTISQRYGVFSQTVALGITGSVNDNVSLNGAAMSDIATSWDVPHIGTGNGRSVGGFGNWRIGVFDQLYLTLGVRGEHNPNYGQDHKIDWTPTNGLAYTIGFGDVTLKLLASYGRATRTPPADLRIRTYITFPDRIPSVFENQRESPDLRPEVSRGPQGGLELYVGNTGSISVNRYRQIIDDLIYPIVVDSTPYTTFTQPETRWHPVWQRINLNKVEQQGWEGNGTINLGPLSLSGTWSWNDSRILAASGYDHGQLLNRGVPTHTGNLRVSYARGTTSLTMTTNFTGASSPESSFDHPILYWEVTRTRLVMYTSVARVRSFGGFAYQRPGYARSDLALRQRLTSKAALTLNVRNLGNSYNSEGRLVSPTLGRNTTIGITWQL